jgi:selenide,water dikinase
MERLNTTAAALALDHGARAATDVTGFGLAGHALAVAQGSGVELRLVFERLPVHAGFYDLVARGVSTGSTAANQSNAEGRLDDRVGLTPAQQELLFDPQTSGGLLVAVPGPRAGALLAALVASGHRAADIGEVAAGPPRLVVT